jgi:uncharacterized membrane protein
MEYICLAVFLGYYLIGLLLAMVLTKKGIAAKNSDTFIVIIVAWIFILPIYLLSKAVDKYLKSC